MRFGRRGAPERLHRAAPPSRGGCCIKGLRERDHYGHSDHDYADQPAGSRDGRPVVRAELGPIVNGGREGLSGSHQGFVGQTSRGTASRPAARYCQVAGQKCGSSRLTAAPDSRPSSERAEMGEHVRAGDLDIWIEQVGEGPDVLLDRRSGRHRRVLAVSARRARDATGSRPSTTAERTGGNARERRSPWRRWPTTRPMSPGV